MGTLQIKSIRTNGYCINNFNTSEDDIMPDYNIQFWNPTKLYLFSFLPPGTGRRKLAFMNINEKNSCRKYLKTTLVMELLLLVYFGSCTLSLSPSSSLTLENSTQTSWFCCCWIRCCWFFVVLVNFAVVVVKVDVIHCKYMKTYVYNCIYVCMYIHTHRF